MGQRKKKYAQPAEAASPLKGRESGVIMSVESVKRRKINREIKEKQTVWWQQLRQFQWAEIQTNNTLSHKLLILLSARPT